MLTLEHIYISCKEYREINKNNHVRYKVIKNDWLDSNDVCFVIYDKQTSRYLKNTFTVVDKNLAYKPRGIINYKTDYFVFVVVVPKIKITYVPKE